MNEVARTVKSKVPSVVGVPVIAPVLVFWLNPGGNAPALMLQVIVPAPPDCEKFCEYDVPANPFAAVVGFTVTTLQPMMVKVLVPVQPNVSVTLTVKLVELAEVSVPETK